MHAMKPTDHNVACIACMKSQAEMSMSLFMRGAHMSDIYGLCECNGNCAYLEISQARILCVSRDALIRTASIRAHAYVQTYFADVSPMNKLHDCEFYCTWLTSKSDQ